MMLSRIRFCSPFLIASVLTAYTTLSQTFTPGNIAVLRVGNGTETLVSSGNSLFVDQYTPAGALVNSTAVPDTGAEALLLSGASSSEGGLTRSLDRTSLILAGYNTNRGSITGSLSSQSAAAVPRAVGTIDAFGTDHLAEASTTLYSSNNIRCAAADGTNSFWTAGNPGGTFYLDPPQTPVAIQSAGGNTRQVKILGETLYFSTQAGTAGVYTFQGGGLPKSADTPVAVLTTGANSQPAGFSINPALTIAYVSDQRPTAGGIQKWTNNGSAWVPAYSFSTGGGAFDVAVDFSGASPVIYATTAEASGNRLITINDAGALSIVKVLATARTNEIFRGVDFAPDLRPAIVSQPQSQTVTNGSDVSLVVAAQSHYALSYQWQKDGTNINGANSSALDLHAVSTADQGTYRVVVTNAYGSVASAGATLTVNQTLTPPTITSQPGNQTVPLGGSATFGVSATGTPPLSYQWQFNGAALPSQTNSNLAVLNAGPADQGSYQVAVSSRGGSTNSQPATLVVVNPASSSVAYTTAGMVYSQNFDSLPNPGITSVNADNPVKINGVTYGLADPFDFTFPILANGVDPNTGIGLGGLGLSNSMPGWYGLGRVAPKLGASAGDQSTGGVISVGLTNSASATTNRALGLLATSSTGTTAFGLKLMNQTTSTLNQITVHFTGELWRQAAISKVLVAGYWIDPRGTNSFSTNLTARLSNLDVVFASNPAATNPVPVDGTIAANQLSIGATNQPIADWVPDTALWLSWQMVDPTGKGQGVAIDDLIFSASLGQGVPSPLLSIQQSGANVFVTWPAAFSGFQLQENSDLRAANGWAAVSQSVTVSNGLNTVVIPLGPSAQFYRLKH
jgi:hypothetical protein